MVLVRQVVSAQRINILENKTLDRSSGTRIINPSDLNALEEALKLKDTLGAEVTVCSMGPASTERLLLETSAMGADRLLLITDPLFAASDTLATARVLHQAIQVAGSFDLVFCGRRSIDGETGQVGPELAAMLDFPSAVNAADIVLADGKVICDTVTEQDTRKISIPIPSLVTFHTSINSPRLPSIIGLRRASSAVIEKLDHHDLKMDPELCGKRGSPTRVLKTWEQQISRRDPKWLSCEESAAEVHQMIDQAGAGGEAYVR